MRSLLQDESHRPRKPDILRQWTLGSAAFAIILLGSLVLAAFGRSVLQVKGEAVPPEAFLREHGLSTGAGGLYALLIWYGLWRGAGWVRIPVLLMVLAIAVYGLVDMTTQHRLDGWKVLVVVVAYLAFLAGVVWYLYMKPNVVAYFASRRGTA